MPLSPPDWRTFACRHALCLSDLDQAEIIKCVDTQLSISNKSRHVHNIATGSSIHHRHFITPSSPCLPDSTIRQSTRKQSCSAVRGEGFALPSRYADIPRSTRSTWSRSSWIDHYASGQNDRNAQAILRYSKVTDQGIGEVDGIQLESCDCYTGNGEDARWHRRGGRAGCGLLLRR